MITQRRFPRLHESHGRARHRGRHRRDGRRHPAAPCAERPDDGPRFRRPHVGDGGGDWGDRGWCARRPRPRVGAAAAGTCVRGHRGRRCEAARRVWRAARAGWSVRGVSSRRDSGRRDGAGRRAVARAAARNLVRDGDARDDPQSRGQRDPRASGGEQPLPVRTGDRLRGGAGRSRLVRSRDMRRWFSRARREDGAALVETAFVLPIMLLVSVGIFEFGRAYQTWQVITNATREGARVAVLPDYTDDSVKARVRTYLKDGGLSAAIVDDTAKTNVEITATTIPVDVGGTVTASAARVVVEYPFEFMVLQPVAQLVVNGSMAGEPFTMRMTTIMRNE